MEKLLTISIAAYNVGEYIRNTLDSLIVPEILDKLEVFIVDDGGNDNTLQIAQEYEEKYPGTFHAVHKENGGYGSTVNYSIAHATGKYFKLLDGDDWFCKENLEELIYFLDSHNEDIILSPYYRVFVETDNKIFIDHYSEINENKRLEDETINNSNILIMHEMCVKTQLLQAQNKKITEHCFYTDYEFVFLSLLGAHTISRFTKPIYCYRIGVEGQSVSMEGIQKHYLDKSKVAYQLYQWYSEQKNREYKGYHKKLLKREMFGITDDAYLAYMVLQDTKKGKRELITFDKNVKEIFPEMYALTMSIKKIAFLRKTNYLAFYFLRRRYLKMLTNLSKEEKWIET